MDLSIVIVNWNTRDLLRGCLSSIRGTDFAGKLETIVVDNDSNDGSAEMVATEFPECRLIAEPTNWGYAKGNNLGFEASIGEFVLTLNPDTELEADTLQAATASLKSHSEHAVLGARLEGFDGQLQPSVRGFPTYFGILGDALGLAKAWPGSVWDGYRLRQFDYGRTGPAPQPMGTFLLFRRSALIEISNGGVPFDESFPIFFNEVDLLYRLQQKGLSCYYDPSVRLRHFGGAGTKQVRPAMIWESHRSLIRFFAKHRLRWWNAPAFALVAATIWVAALIRARGFHAGFRP